jgi:hypothetical protein
MEGLASKVFAHVNLDTPYPLVTIERLVSPAVLLKLTSMDITYIQPAIESSSYSVAGDDDDDSFDEPSPVAVAFSFILEK